MLVALKYMNVHICFTILLTKKFDVDYNNAFVKKKIKLKKNRGKIKIKI